MFFLSFSLLGGLRIRRHFTKCCGCGVGCTLPLSGNKIYRVDWKKVVWKNMFLKDIANGMLTVEPEKSESGSRKCTFPFSNTIWQRSLSSAFCTHMMGSTENLSCENLKLRKSCKSVYMFVYVKICVNMCILCTCVQYITFCATMNSINRLLS